MADNYYSTSDDGFVNYYTTRPESDDSNTVIDNILDTLNPAPVTVTYNTAAPKVSDRDEAPTFRLDQKFLDKSGSTGSVNVNKFSYINPATVKYDDFNSYLKSQHSIDRVGNFSGVTFKTKEERLKMSTEEKMGTVASGLSGDGTPLFGLTLLGSLTDTRAVSDPTGTRKRYIPSSGVFNPLATMAIASEFKDMAAIRDAYEANPSATMFEKGFIFEMNGKSIRRLPGGAVYRGQLEQAGLTQQTAKTMEKLITGSALGAGLIASIKQGNDDPSKDTPTGITGDMGDAILATSGGGYTLRGTFNFGSGTAAMGNMSDFEDIAATTFRVALGEGQAKPVIDGVVYDYDVFKSRDIARSWLDGARAFRRGTSVEDQIAHLQNMIGRATNQSDINTGKTTTTTSATTAAAVEDVVTADDERPDDTGGNQQDPESGNDDGYSPGGKGEGRTDYQGAPSKPDRPSTSGPLETAIREASSPRDGGNPGGRTGSGVATGRDDPSYGGGRALGGPVGYATGDMVEDQSFVTGDQSTQQGDPIISMNELVENQPTEQSGFINRPPSQVSDAKSVADDKPMKAEATGIVLNAEAVIEAGEQDVARMIEEARAYRRKTGTDDPAADEKNTPPQDIQISEGEVYITPEDVAVIGRDRLTKINNRGKPKTKEKIARLQKAAEGGFVKKKGYAEGTDEGGIDSSLEFLNDAYSQFKNKFPGKSNTERVSNARKKAAELIQGMNPEDALALTMIGEASVLGDEGMEGVAHVIFNRMNSTYNEYRDQQSVYDVVTRRIGNNPYQFNALEYKTLRKTLKDVSTTEYGKNKFMQMRQIAEDILAGNREDTTSGSLLFWNPETSTNDHIRQGIADGIYEVAYTQTNQGGQVHEFIRPVQQELAKNSLNLEGMYPSLYGDTGMSTDVSFSQEEMKQQFPNRAPDRVTNFMDQTSSTPAAAMAAGPVQFNPQAQSVDQNLSIQAFRDEPDTSFMTTNP